MKKDHMRYLGDNKRQATWSESDEGLSFDSFDTLPRLPETSKPIDAWNPGLCYREEKCIDGTRHHYL